MQALEKKPKSTKWWITDAVRTARPTNIKAPGPGALHFTNEPSAYSGEKSKAGSSGKKEQEKKERADTK